jgi:sugar-specific transcriptional regulator TrmB
LDDKEIKVYLALLELGETHIVPITEKVELPRTTVFHILERLKFHKLIEKIPKKTRSLYIPYPPKKIANLIELEKSQAEERLKSFHLVLPELSKLYTASPFEPKIRFFRGREMREIYEEILTAGVDESWYVGEANKIVQALGEEYLKKWIQRRVKIGIKSRSIRVKKEESPEPIFSGQKKYLRQIRYAPEDFESPMHILIYGNNTAYISTGQENFGLVISSQELAKTMRNWFKELWKAAK